VTQEPVFLGVEHVLAVHHRVIAEFGGDPAVRDMALLESAVAMPAARFGGAYLHDGLPAMAAAYLFHICKGHPFVDGNKRTAEVTAEVFLLLNGLRLRVRDDAVERLTVGVAEGRVSKEKATEFFQQHGVGDRR
jgi:death-on-curing protein